MPDVDRRFGTAGDKPEYPPFAPLTLMEVRGKTMKSVALRFFGDLAESYDRTADYAMLFQDRRWKDWAARWLRPSQGSLVLDVGCGTLIFEERMRRLGCRFVCLDLAVDMVRMGQRKNLPNIALLMNGDAEFLPFPDESFDLVVSCYVAKYVDTRRFAEELARVTKSGARVAIYDLAKPRGPLAPLIEIYIQGGLRIIGLVLALLRRKEAFTFRRLPSVVEQTVWDRRIVRDMEGKGFESLATARLTSGVVFAYCGVRRRGP